MTQSWTRAEIYKVLSSLQSLKTVDDYYLPIRNWPLFEKMRQSGQIIEIEPGIWTLSDDWETKV